MTNTSLPTIDLSPFVTEGGDEDGKKKAMEMIGQACFEFGFFQIVNHGVPPSLIAQALKLSEAFFNYPDEEKLKVHPDSGGFLPSGYNKQPSHSLDKNEYFVMFSPSSGLNVFPKHPPRFREVLEEIFKHLTKTGMLVESILNECLGLPPNFLKEFNHDRSWDLMTAKRYFPATKEENNGISDHEDGNCFTFVFQDEAGGLQVRTGDRWVPVIPVPDTIVVNVGDVLQVLSNEKFKSATHRVVRPKGKSRYSYTFFYNLQGDKWVEPLPQFTKDIGKAPKYKGFMYKEYQELRIRNKTHPPSRPEDVIHITHYAISQP